MNENWRMNLPQQRRWPLNGEKFALLHHLQQNTTAHHPCSAPLGLS